MESHPDRSKAPRNEADEAIEDFMGEDPRADELAEMISALEQRRETFSRERDSAGAPDSRKQWTARIRAVDEQIRILREEQTITGFVERSIRAAVNRPRIDLDDEDPGY